MIRLALALALLLLTGQSRKPPIDIPITVITAGDALVGIRNLKNWDTRSTPTGFYQTLEQCFAVGAVPSGKIAEPRKGDGTTVMTNWQADNRILWGDNSLRCARFTFKYPSQLAASGTDTLKFYSTTGSWNNTPWATATTTILTQDFRMEVVISGTPYTCGVNNEINRGNTYQFDAGPTAVGLVVHGVFRNGTGSSSTDQGALHCRVYVVAFEDGTFKVWGRADSCRPSNSTCAAASVTSAALKNGVTSLWSNGSFTFYGGTFYVAADTDGQPYYSGTTVRKIIAGFPQPVLAKLETTNLWDAKLMPFYKVTNGAIALMNGATNAITYFPIAMGDFTGQSIDGTGDHPWVGLMNSFSAIAMFKADWTSMRQDAIDALAEGAQNWHFRDHNNGNLLNLNGTQTYTGLTQNTSVGWCVSATITITGGSPYGGAQTCNASHLPSFVQYQFYYSGEEWWLDQYQDVVVGVNGSRNPGTICYARNPFLNTQWWAAYGVGFSGAQMREIAWYGRDLQNVAWMTPTAHPLHDYMQDLVAMYWGASQDWLTSPNGGCTAGGAPWTADFAPLGLYPASLAPWMYDFWSYTASFGVLRGQVSTSNLMISHVQTRFVIGRGVNGCAYSAAPYNLSMAINNAASFGPPWATSWSQIYIGVDSGPNLNPGAPIQNTEGTGCPSGGIDHNAAYGFQAWGNALYPNFFYDSALLAKEAGVTGAASMVTYYAASKLAERCCSDADVAIYPQWAMAQPQ